MEVHWETPTWLSASPQRDAKGATAGDNQELDKPLERRRGGRLHRHADLFGY